MSEITGIDDWRPEMFDQVGIFADGLRIHTADVTAITTRRIAPRWDGGVMLTTPPMYYDVTLTNVEKRLDKRIIKNADGTVGKVFSVEDGFTHHGNVIQYLRDTYAFDENIWIGPAGFNGLGAEITDKIIYGLDGPVSVWRAMQQLAEQSEYALYVTPDLELKFHERTAVYAPIELYHESNNFREGSLVVNQTAADFRTHQVVRVGWEAFEPLVSTFSGNGSTMQFELEEGGAAVPVAHIESIDFQSGEEKYPQNFAPAQFDETTGDLLAGDYEWFWEPGTSHLYQHPDGLKLQTGESLIVTFRKLGADVVTSAATLSEETREYISSAGTSIDFYRAGEDLSIKTQGDAEATAQATVDTHSTFPREIQFRTEEPGLEPGQLLNINLPEFDLYGAFLIDAVNAKDIGPDYLEYDVTCIENAKIPGGVEYFRDNDGLIKRRKTQEFATGTLDEGGDLCIFGVGGDGAVEVGTNVSNWLHCVRRPGTCYEATVTVPSDGAPASATTLVVMRSTDNGSSWSAILTLTVPAGFTGRFSVTDFGTADVDLLADDLLRIDCTASGGGEHIWVRVRYKRLSGRAGVLGDSSTGTTEDVPTTI
jgi:hypothetical protein